MWTARPTRASKIQFACWTRWTAAVGWRTMTTCRSCMVAVPRTVCPPPGQPWSTPSIARRRNAAKYWSCPWTSWKASMTRKARCGALSSSTTRWSGCSVRPRRRNCKRTKSLLLPLPSALAWAATSWYAKRRTWKLQICLVALVPPTSYST